MSVTRIGTFIVRCARVCATKAPGTPAACGVVPRVFQFNVNTSQTFKAHHHDRDDNDHRARVNMGFFILSPFAAWFAAPPHSLRSEEEGRQVR